MVACESKGVEAFSVGRDFIAEAFKGSFDASNLYYNPEYNGAGKIGHANDFGEYTSFEDYYSKACSG